MNNILAIGFYAEGITDIRFLSKVIFRTTEQIILNRNSSMIDFYDPSEIKVKKPVIEHRKFGKRQRQLKLLVITS
jgi:hypothetical protein